MSPCSASLCDCNCSHIDSVSSSVSINNKTHIYLWFKVVCVLSHGEKGCVFGTDGGKVLLKDLTDPFTSGRARTLAGKPKLFFIQACQGEEYQKGYYPSSKEDEKQNKGALQSDASIPDEAVPVPELADFLIGMATVEEFKSFRNTVTGSIYIQELCKQLTIAARRWVEVISFFMADHTTDIWEGHSAVVSYKVDFFLMSFLLYTVRSIELWTKTQML